MKRQEGGLKEMMDNIAGINGELELGLIPQYLKEGAIENQWKTYKPMFLSIKLANNLLNPQYLVLALIVQMASYGAYMNLVRLRE